MQSLEIINVKVEIPNSRVRRGFDSRPGLYGFSGPNGMMYIGSSLNVSGRISHHLGNLKRSAHHCWKLQSAYDAGDNLKPFVFEYLDDIELLRQKEFQLLKQNKGKLYNSVISAHGAEGVEVMWNDKTYSTIKHFALVCGVHEETARKKLALGVSPQQIYLDKFTEHRRRADHHLKPVILNDSVKFKSIGDFAKACKVQASRISYRLKCGKSFNDIAKEYGII